MRGLTILLTSDDAERLFSALSIAAANAAAGGAARIFCEGLAVRTLIEGTTATQDQPRKAAGLPTLSQLREEAAALGVVLIACQGGMALAGLTIGRLGPDVEAGGLTSVMTSLGDDRLIAL
ncbi:DsrE family protein [uncultured Parasphingopyxis sp.]|mgnify:FL=1|uniref:DsrE family protein n=1 Tax=uncultured Parasphingopyxis sp. TaxID=1547918 RepID=UPI002605F85F|nr:DsrE family protein [uncultured Parasphingopyxis sp.]